MRVDGPGSVSALALRSLLNVGAAPASGGTDAPSPASGAGQQKPAVSAAPGKIFPASLYGGLSANTILSLQADNPASSDGAEIEPSPEETFLKEARKNPLERLIEQWRKQALESMGLTEGDLKGMDAGKLAGVEKKIADFIRQKLKEALGTDAAASGDSGASAEDAGALMVKFG
ncbi:MAG: hypothetical protein GC155_18295 [Alphaproteobacteria bacterium]|nr:hypothetical protein [Alphaproteobacteria bacterium]